VSFLGVRAIAGVEELDGDAYRRTIRIECDDATHAGWIAVSPKPKDAALLVVLSGSLSGVAAEACGRVAHVMDLDADPHAIAAVLGPIGQPHTGLRVPGAFDGFEMGVRAIVGQQISVKAARTLVARFAAAFGTPLQTPFAAVSRVFPSAREIARLEPEHIAGLGIIASRARSILALAQALTRGDLTLEPGADAAVTLDVLRALPGIGEWTAQYIAMRALGWRDAFPHGDLVLMRALGERDAKRVLAISEAWRPWRAYAAMHLWRASTLALSDAGAKTK
jgi:AraC family transcriptional regulator of adaptative response / DNA-3-methyladenine glycosylase II